MPRKLTGKIADKLKEYGYGAEACWDCHGTWVVYHKVLEEIAGLEAIEFQQPHIINSDIKDKMVSLCVTGTLGERTEWSIGEAAPYNNKNSYPYAMAEKRGKDRVILKLIGLHGLLYSEDEADDFKKYREGNPPERDNTADTTRSAREIAEELRGYLKVCESIEDFNGKIHAAQRDGRMDVINADPGISTKFDDWCHSHANLPTIKELREGDKADLNVLGAG